ncbi:MAG TPA: glucose 1-dehydrogenase [Syntrophales bacterium]|nr:glucose 1-dehydrogenase [Syntrophales bacterium]
MGVLNQFGLCGRVAIVTGGSKGLGRAMALGLAEAGAKLVVVSRTQSLIEETADEIIKKGGEALAVPTDVRSEEDVERMVALVAEKYGRIDILINNAGIGGSRKVVTMTADEWSNMMDTNVKSIFLAVRAVGKVMIRQRSGKVINVSSVLGKGALPRSMHYGASKAAIIHMTKTLALEWAPFNIHVNGIAPGWFLTEMTKDQQEGENREFLVRRIPFGRFGNPEEMVGLAVFLASDASNYITGDTVFIDGGYSLW